MTSKINEIVYEKESFNYEEYKCKCLATGANITKLLFVKSAK